MRASPLLLLASGLLPVLASEKPPADSNPNHDVHANPNPQPHIHDPPAARRAALLPRSTSIPGLGSLSDSCLSNAVSFLKSMPTPSPELLQAIDTPTNDGCFSLPQSLDDDFSSYSSSVQSWASKNEELISSAGKNCPQATELPDPEFCKGMGPEDREDGVGRLGVSGVAVGVCAALGVVMMF